MTQTQQQQQTFTKLSEAIRYGATLRPKTVGAYFRERDSTISSCSLGAAWEAVTGRAEVSPEEDVDAALARIFHLSDKEERSSDSHLDIDYPYDLIIIPRPGGGCSSIFATVTYMNDTLQITREEIANYLERLGY